MATSNPFGDPQTQALLGLAQGLLAAGAPSQFPTNLSGALAQGVGGALSGAMNAQKYNLAQQQVALTGLNAAHAQFQAALQSWLLNGRKGPPPTPPAFNFPGMPQPQAQDQTVSTAGAGPTAAPPAYGQPGFQPAGSQPSQPSSQPASTDTIG